MTDWTPEGPFRGLVPYREEDALLFFGRERERAVLVANLLASRLTVLYGPSGAGKSSLLRAGVTHTLRELIASRQTTGRVVFYDRWSDDPDAGLTAAIVAECGELGATAGLPDLAAAATDAIGGPLFLVLDQFEEVFLYDHARALVAELSDLLARSTVDVHVLIGVRDDALSQLDVLKARVPNLFSNLIRLERLDRDGAREAILRPLEQFAALTGSTIGIEPQLVEAVLDQAAAAPDATGNGHTASGIEAPYLQLVLERVWQVELAAGSRTLRRETLDGLGGTAAISRGHLERALGMLRASERDVAAAALNQLVTPSGTKIAHRAADLAQYAHLDEDELRPVLNDLSAARILRPIRANGAELERWEIFHDVLAAPIAAWRARWAIERERRRFVRVALIGAAALTIFVGIAAVAIVEWSRAQDSARHARGRELSARALSALPVDGREALRLALDAARLDPSGQTEAVLRAALLGAHERAVSRLGGHVVSIQLDRTEQRALVASTSGLVRVLNRRGHTVWQRRAPTPLVTPAFSDDGRRVAFAGPQSVELWNVGNDRAGAWKVAGGVSAVAFAGDRIAAGTERGVDLIAPKGGRIAVALPGRPTAIEASQDGGRLGVVFTDDADRSRAALVDADRGRLSRLLPGRGVTAIAFSADGRVATASTDRTSRIWSASGRQLHVLQHKGRVLDVEFSRDGMMLASASADGAARIWDAASGDRLLLLVGPIGSVTDVAFSADGRFLIVGTSDRTARVYDTESGRQLSLLTGHRDAVTQVSLTATGRLALTGSADGAARIWEPGVADQLIPFDHGDEPVRRLLLDSDATHVLIAREHNERLLDVKTGAVSAALQDDTGFLSEALPPSNGHAAVRDTASVRDLETADVLLLPSAEDGDGMTYTGSGRLAALSGAQLTVRDPDGTRYTTPIARPGIAIAGNPASETVAVILRGGEVRLLHLGLDETRRGLPGKAKANSVLFSQDGKTLVTTWAKQAFVWDADTRELLHTFTGHRGTITSAVLSRDGRMLVTGSLDHDARIWSLAEGRLVAVLRGHLSPIYGVSISADRRWVATAGQGSVGIWDASTGQALTFVRGANAPLTNVAFGAPTALIAGSLDGAAYVYRCDVCAGLAALEELAERRLKRG